MNTIFGVGNVQQSTTSSQPPIPGGRGAYLPFDGKQTAGDRRTRFLCSAWGPRPHAFRFSSVSLPCRPPMLRAISFSFLSLVDRDTSIDIISDMETQARWLEMMKKPGDLGARTVDYGLAVLADGCWRLAVGHCRRKKRFPIRQEGKSFLMRRPYDVHHQGS